MSNKLSYYAFLIWLFYSVCSYEVFARPALIKEIRGYFKALVVQISVDTKTVQSWLPKELLLRDDTSDEHPIILMMGTQHNLQATIRRKLKISLAQLQNYRETIVAIPNVGFNSHLQISDPYIHYARLYLDNELAVTMGIKHFGFPKLMSQIDTTEAKYIIRSHTDQLNTLLEAEHTVDRSVDISNDNPHMDQIKTALNRKLISIHNSTYSCKNFDLNFDNAQLFPATATVTIFEDFMPDISAATFSVQDIRQNNQGAFWIETNWSSKKTRCQPPSNSSIQKK